MAAAKQVEFKISHFKPKLLPIFSFVIVAVALFLLSGGVHAIYYNRWESTILAFSAYTESSIGLMFMYTSAKAKAPVDRLVMGFIVFWLGMLSLQLMGYFKI